MKHSKPNNTARRLLFGLGVLAYRLGLARAIIRLSPHRVRAILYHAIEPQSSAWTRGLGVNITPADFAANLDYFQSHYNVVDVMDLTDGKPILHPLVITFDDGYQSVATHAAPALAKRSMPATVYLISRAVRGKLVWVNLLNGALHNAPDETRAALASIPHLAHADSNSQIMRTVQETFQPAAIEQLCETIERVVDLDKLEPPEPLYMSSETIKSLAQDNIHFGFHTRDHYNMRQCSRDELAQQLDSSDINDCINSASFAYPFGYFNETAVGSVESQGYQKIMTVGNNNRRYCTKHLDRIEVFSDNPAHVFAQIEVVEPVISIVRRLVLKMKGRYNTHAPRSVPSNPSA